MIRTTRCRAVTGLVVAAATAGLALTALPAQALPAYSTQTVTVTRAPTPTPHLTDIRTGRHATFDRVVLDLAGRPSGYKVGYVRTVREDGSGRVIPMRGSYYLMIRLTPAEAHTDSGAPTYDGPHKLWVGYPELRQVAFAGDFEAVVSVALGLRYRHGFRVFTLRDPTRIVVDVRH